MNRPEAREAMMKLFYEMDIWNDCDPADTENRLGYFDVDGQHDYCISVLKAYFEHRGEIDGLIADHSPRWQLERIPKTDLAMLRLAVSEMLYLDEVPVNVSISEAVRICRIYGTEDSRSYVNGILSSINREAYAPAHE